MDFVARFFYAEVAVYGDDRAHHAVCSLISKECISWIITAELSIVELDTSGLDSAALKGEDQLIIDIGSVCGLREYIEAA